MPLPRWNILPMYQALFDILEWRKDKPIVFTSNKSVRELAELALTQTRVARIHSLIPRHRYVRQAKSKPQKLCRSS